jgi:chromosome segregation ATPase
VAVQIREKELKVVTIQNEIAKLTVDVLNTDTHNVRLDDTLRLLDDELRQKAGVIEKYEAELRKRNDEIEKKTRAVDGLNRKLEKLLEKMDGDDTGAQATVACISTFRGPCETLLQACATVIGRVPRTCACRPGAACASADSSAPHFTA